MKRIGVVTDSIANLPSDVILEKDIKVLPVKIAFGLDVYLDGVDLKPVDFYRLMESSRFPPVIAPPSSRDFLDMFESMREEGYEGAVCILCCNLCQSYSPACEARDFLRPFPVMIIDSHTVSMSQGFLVLEAVKAAEKGLPITDIVDRVWNLRPRVRFFALAGMLHYLVRSGRMGKFQAYLRALLNITPVLTVNRESGALKTAARVKSRQQGLEFLLHKIEEDLKERQGGALHVAVIHADELETAKRFYQDVSRKFNPKEMYLVEISPAISCHLGPGVIGVHYYVEQDDQ